MKQSILLVLMAVCLLPEAEGATFQYIFNNVEQGPGGKANPSISIQGQQVKKNGVPVSPETVAAEEAPAGTIASSQETEPLPIHQRFRFLAAGARVSQDSGSSLRSTERDLKHLTAQDGGATMLLGLSFWAAKDLAFTGLWMAPGATGKQEVGAELEYVPVRVAIMGREDFVEAAALLGGSSLGKEQLGKAGTLHAGGRLNVNFHRQLGITGAARSNLTDRSRYRYAQAELGLAYRF